MSKIKNFLLITSSITLLAAAGVYLAIGLFLHDILSDISGRCQDKTNRPDRFSDVTDQFDHDNPQFPQYQMETFETVTFESREAGLTMSGWYVPGEANGPAVIVVHGLGSCKYSDGNLIQAGMLNNAGFSVLLIDVRDSGDSDYEDGRSAIGNEEYLDVLGAFDWLQAAKGHSADRIGVLGNSLGAATALMAFSNEPQLAAAFVDSPFDNLPQIIKEELDREGYPRFLYVGGIIGARLRGDRVLSHNPYDALTNANGRPLFVTHGTADERIGVHHSAQLEARAAEAEANATFWIVEGTGHVQAVKELSDQYDAKLVAFFAEALR